MLILCLFGLFALSVFILWLFKDDLWAVEGIYEGKLYSTKNSELLAEFGSLESGKTYYYISPKGTYFCVHCDRIWSILTEAEVIERLVSVCQQYKNSSYARNILKTRFNVVVPEIEEG